MLRKLTGWVVIYFILTSMVWLFVIVNAGNAENQMGAYYLITMGVMALVFITGFLGAWAVEVINE